jgi:hypothetical protein
MRKQTRVDLVGKGGKKIKVTVFELSVKQIRDIVSVADPAIGKSPAAPAGDLSDSAALDMETILAWCTDLDPATVLNEDLAPSDLKKLYDAFAEVNADFLSLARNLGLFDLAKDLIQKLLTQAFADLSKAATAALGTMGFPSSPSVSPTAISSGGSGSGSLP